ncbi:MAG: ATP-binding protein [Vicinamibacteria bacterium]|nr:ATP-binding protein [Vicinamibacteria bacterium]
MNAVRRERYQKLLRLKLRRFPAVVLLGPRQSGKSTLALGQPSPRGGRKQLFDLERPSDLARLRAAPEQDLGALQATPGLIVMDEVQREPTLFPLLRPLLDASTRKARYLLLGSASPALVAGASESLAGRAAFVDLTPFLMCELAPTPVNLARLWLRGGYPRSYLARSDAESLDWRESYLRAVLERDVPALRPGLPVATLSRLLTMLAHLHGGILNESELAGSLGITAPTVGRYIDLLEGLFMIRRLPPYFANVGKRLTKSPRVYLRDSGALHALLGIRDDGGLRSHPKVGASWEGFLIEQILGALTLLGETPRGHFWRTSGGAEVDLILEVGGRRVAIEIKLSGSPSISRGMHECLKDLSCPGFIVHGGRDEFAMGDSVRALPAHLAATPERLRKALLG